MSVRLIRSLVSFVIFLFFSVKVLAAPSCHSFLKYSASEFEFKSSQDLHANIEAFYGGEMVGHIKFDFESESNTLTVQYVKVDFEFRRNDLSKHLLKAALDQHPQTLFIKGELADKNLELYNLAKIQIAGGQRWPTYEDSLRAVKLTPFYLIRRAMGFSQIIHFEEDHYSVKLHLAKDSVTTDQELVNTPQ